MKILIFEIWHVSPQLETGLELAELHAERGDDVTYVNIGGKLPYIEWYSVPTDAISKKLYDLSVRSKINKAKGLCRKDIKFHTALKLESKEVDDLKEDIAFENLDGLKSYTWKGIDIGLAALSSFITDTNDMAPNVQDLEYKFNEIIWSSKIVTQSFEKYLQMVEPDKVYFRNGRVSNYRPILRICQQKKIDFEVHDRACDRFHYSLGPTYRHDWDMRKREMANLWRKGSDKDRQRIGQLFFEEKRNRSDDSFKVFAKGQKAGALPDSWDESKFNVVFFNSSISEYVAVGDEVNPNRIYEGQEQAITDLKNQLKDRANAKFYLRLHPNLLNQSQTEKDIWYNMGDENLEIIFPDEEIDTYSVVDKSDLVICYLSTIGIEAAFAKKPVILLGRGLYEDLGVCYVPQSKSELYDLLKRNDLPPKPMDNAVIYGFYMKTHGLKYKFYKPIDHRNGTFKGQNLQRFDYSSWKRKFNRILQGVKRLRN